LSEKPTPEPAITLDLTQDQRKVLISGVSSWMGPGYRPSIIMRALMLSERTELRALGGRLSAALHSNSPLPASDWARALLMTEVGFVSRVAGQGSQWTATTSLRDEETIIILRTIQARMHPLLRAKPVPNFLLK
jgi:hypothetical protein